MAKARPTAPPAPDAIAQLREEMAALKNHIHLLIDAIDEVREELSWLTRNALPSREPLPPVPVLKRMAANPCADDWGQRLMIERGDVGRPPGDATAPPAEPVVPPTPPLLSARPGHLF